MCRCAFLVSVVAVAAFAQDQPVIRGRVLETPSNTPLAGATVQVVYTSGPENETGPSTYTDAQGSYTLKLARTGRIELSAEKPGYSAREGGGKTTLRVNVLANDTFELSLMRPASLSGRVINENGAPLTNTKVQLWMPGRDALYREVATNDEGIFIDHEALPAAFIARVVGAEPHLLEATADADLVEHLPRDSYWPGGTEARETAIPIDLAPGVAGDLGTLRISTSPHYRVRVRVLKTDCETPGSLYVIRTGSRGVPLRLPIICASEFVVAGLAPGPYTFGLYLGIESPQWSLASIDVRRQGETIEMPLASMGRIVGRVVAAEGASIADLPRPHFTLQADSDGLPILIPSARPDDEGRFEFETVAWPLHKLTPWIERGFYVQSIRTGRGDGLIPLVPGGDANIEVVIDNQGATLTVSADPAGDAFVVLTGPVSHFALSGQSTFRDLPPGDYRVVAFPRTVPVDFTRLAQLGERMAAQATPVTLKRGETKTIQLRLSEVPR